MKKSSQVYFSPTHTSPIAVDFYWKEAKKRKPVVLFLHGFKGFKDWGHWAAIAATFVEEGYCFVAMNFSHNGTTTEQPLDFADLEAFGYNNYSKELADVHQVIEEITEVGGRTDLPALEVDNITLIGHSRGGPIALITALEQPVVRRVVTWAGVHALDYRWADDAAHVKEWKEKGVVYVYNGRTHQQMPLYYQLYEDFQNNQERLSVEKTLAQLEKPHLILHGTADPAVSSESADYLEQQGQQAQKVLIENANHVFGGMHPFYGKELPTHSQILVQETLNFITQTS
ncbi:MAG: alpha/beta hydrolase family protein [Aureispira sp.]